MGLNFIGSNNFSEEPEDLKQAAAQQNAQNEAYRIEAFPVKVEDPEPGSLPPHIKVDFTIAEESILPGCGCVLIFAGFFLLNITWNLLGPYPAGFIMALGLILILMRAGVDNFYVINTAERKIYYRRKFFNQSSITPFLEPDDIFAVSVSGASHTSKSSKWWDYRVVIIKKDGKIVDFSDAERSDYALEFNKKALGLAAVLGCGYIESPDKRELFASKELNGGVKVYFIKKDF